MIMVNIFEAKAKLSEYLDAVSRGERVMICKRNRPVAELRPVAAAPAKRTLGAAAGAVTMTPAFFDPLPDDLLEAFGGNAGQRPQASEVAESGVAYGTSKKRK